MKIRKTLNLGKTKFPMRGNLPIKEVEREKEWEKNDVYEQRQKLNSYKPSFVLHDGPPYANGNIHMGHAMNKISKDFIIRSKSMMGYRAPFVPGWDTHGLPIEQQLKKNGIDRKSLSIIDFRKKCRNYALKQVEKQKKDFKRLGISAEWNNPYLTLNSSYEAQEIRIFGKMVERGLIYKGKKPVFWSWSSESALAEAEVEYHNVTSPSIFYAERVVDGRGVLDDNTYMIVWTTTPWTIPASEGITISSDFDYSVIQHDDDPKEYVIASELLEKDVNLFNWSNIKILKVVKGKQLEHIQIQHPFYPDRKLIVMLGEFVTLDAGTGLVHTAPGFGEDDYNIGIKYGLDIYAPVDSKGYLTSETGPDFANLFYEDANDVSINKLKKLGLLIKKLDYEHSYPFDWRTKKPVIFRATPQWFASVNKIRNEILDSINQIKFIPEWGQKRLYNMIRDRNDWVISRQRVWGVPLPIFYAEDNEPIMTPETIEYVAELVERNGSNIWFELDAKDLLPEGFTSNHSPNGKFTKETDIMDVWFDSGSSHHGVLDLRSNLIDPADLILEGSDQYRGWFNSSLITSIAAKNKSPYKQVISQGFTLDSKGHKMSKSLGNIISPNDVIKQYGADVVRLWVLSADTSSDVRVSMDSFKQISENYRKIRNTIRFLLANTSDFNPKLDSIPFEKMDTLDQYMEILANQFTKNILDDYANYNFIDIYKVLIHFISIDLSSFYLDIAKDVVYIEGPSSLRRRSMQTVFYDILVRLVKLMTPIIPHTAEEIWSFLNENEKYVQLSEMPDVNYYDNQFEMLENWNILMKIRSYIYKSLELARNKKMIGKSFEAHVTLYVSEETISVLNKLNVNIRQIMIVSALDILPLEYLKDTSDNITYYSDELAVKIEKADGKICKRCWMIRKDVGSDSKFPQLCESCVNIIYKYYPEAVEQGLED